MLMKLTPGLNFINVLCTAFVHVDPKSVRIQQNPQYLFTLLGSTCAKAVRRTLMKLTPGRDQRSVQNREKTLGQTMESRGSIL
jgi:hypothetical protein